MKIYDDGALAAWTELYHIGFPVIYEQLVSALNRRRVFIGMDKVAIPTILPDPTQQVQKLELLNIPSCRVPLCVEEMLNSIQVNVDEMEKSGGWCNANGSAYSGYNMPLISSPTFQDLLTIIENTRRSLEEHRYKLGGVSQIHTSIIWGKQYANQGYETHFWEISQPTTVPPPIPPWTIVEQTEHGVGAGVSGFGGHVCAQTSFAPFYSSPVTYGICGSGVINNIEGDISSWGVGSHVRVYRPEYYPGTPYFGAPYVDTYIINKGSNWIAVSNIGWFGGRVGLGRLTPRWITYDRIRFGSVTIIYTPENIPPTQHLQLKMTFNTKTEAVIDSNYPGANAGGSVDIIHSVKINGDRYDTQQGVPITLNFPRTQTITVEIETVVTFHDWYPPYYTDPENIPAYPLKATSALGTSWNFWTWCEATY